jgi:adenylate kinase
MLNERNEQINAVIALEVEDSELIERLLNRGKVSGRSDDNLETIQKRLQVYHSQTTPLIEYYKEENLYNTIEGSGSIDEIFARIKAVIKNL